MTERDPIEAAARWFGLRCALRMCPCMPEWLGKHRDQHWACCLFCGEPRVPLNRAAELAAELEDREHE